jgi:WD40 repeat protein
MCILPAAVVGSTSTTDDIKIITGHSAAVAGVAVDHVHGVFYTGDTDGILCKWDLTTCEPICRLEPAEGNDDLMYVVHGGAISGLATTASGSLLSVGWDDKMFVTDKTGSVGLEPVSLGAQPSAITTGTTQVVRRCRSCGKVLKQIKFRDSGCVSRRMTRHLCRGRRKVHVYDVTDLGLLSEKKVIDGIQNSNALALSTTEPLASEMLAMLYMGCGR